MERCVLFHSRSLMHCVTHTCTPIQLYASVCKCLGKKILVYANVFFVLFNTYVIICIFYSIACIIVKVNENGFYFSQSKVYFMLIYVNLY